MNFSSSRGSATERLGLGRRMPARAYLHIFNENMAQCRDCRSVLVNGASYCHNCGSRIEVLTDGDAGNDERKMIEFYFHLGYKYEVIVDLLNSHHGVSMSIRTLKRRLETYGLSRRNNVVDEETLKNLIKQEAQGAGCLKGYRAIWHTLRIKHHIHVPRSLVATYLREIDPESSRKRRMRRLHRRRYVSYGPNHCWHIDGYDKLKPYGFPIHGAVDGYSRKILWLEVTRSNNCPQNIARMYLDCIKNLQGCPLLTRTDCGTENGTLAALQCYFRKDDNFPFAGENAHKYGTSTTNQRIENWWSSLRRASSNWWINFFKDMTDANVLNTSSELHKECMWFCFSGILQGTLDQVKEYWNTHYIRSSRHETTAGVPDILYYLPERSNTYDCSVPLPPEKINEGYSLCEQAEEDENMYQEYFHYMMEINGIQYPANHEQAYNLYLYLVNIAD